MPKVETYNADQVQTQVVSQPRASGGLPAAAFGAPVAEGVGALGVAVAQMKQRIDVTAAEEAMVQFEREKNELLFNPEKGYFNTQGRNAFDGAEVTYKSLEETKKKYSESLSPSARALFERTAANHITRAQQDISRHASQGLKAWEVATLESQVENTIENASLYWNDPQAMKVQNALGRQAILDAAAMQGLGAEATNERLQTFDSSFTRAAIQSAVSQSSVEGSKLLESMGDRLEGPDRVKIEKMIVAKAAAEKTQADAQYALIKGRELVDRFDDRQQIMDQADQIEDPELRKKVMSEAMHLLSQRKQAESEARATAYESAESYIMQGGSAEEFKAERPEDWMRLSPSQQRKIESGKVVATDWETFSGLMIMPKEELAKVDPTDYFDKLGPTERGKLISAVKSAKNMGSDSDKVESQVGRTRAAQTTAAVEQLFGAKAKRNNEDRQRVEQFYAMLDEEVAFREQQKGSKLTSEEYTNVLSGFTRAAVVERKWLPGTTDMLITDIPVEDLDAVNKFLRDNGIPVTSENIIKVYKQASQ